MNKPQNNDLTNKDLKNSETDKCPICKEKRPASVNISRRTKDKEARYESINVCHICAGRGSEDLFAELDKRK